MTARLCAAIVCLCDGNAPRCVAQEHHDAACRKQAKATIARGVESAAANMLLKICKAKFIA